MDPGAVSGICSIAGLGTVVSEAAASVRTAKCIRIEEVVSIRPLTCFDPLDQVVKAPRHFVLCKGAVPGVAYHPLHKQVIAS